MAHKPPSRGVGAAQASAIHGLEIDRHRIRTEKRLTRLLDQAGGNATIDDIKSIIFEVDGETPFSVYVAKLAEFFRGEDTDSAIPAIQDAWNYFPHRRFDGLCPAEQMLRLVPGLKPRDLRA